MTKHRDVIGVGYMGAVEDELTHAWTQAWLPIRLHIRSQAFLDQLGSIITPDNMIALVESYVDRGAEMYTRIATSSLNQVVITAATVLTPEIPQLMLVKALVDDYGGTNPFRYNTPAWVRWQQRHGFAPTAPSMDPYTRYRDAARDLTFGMVDGITGRMKVRLRTLIVQAFRQGDTPENIAQRVANVIGLNDRWAIAVENLRTSMIASGVHQRWIDKRTARYADELLFKRGVMVARTEMMTAMNAGEYQAWKLKQDAGELVGWVVEKWIETQSGACDECVGAADPEGMGEPRKVTGLDATFDGLIYPPLHPHCRCVVKYQLVRR